MADKTVVHMGENSPEEVAYKLLQDVMKVEDRATYNHDKVTKADRKYLLDTYAECLMSVSRPWDRDVMPPTAR